jgi:Uma2 family endonuclease
MADIAGGIGEGQKMSRDVYRRWAAEQPRGRFERIDGRAVAMAPQRLHYVNRKAMIWLALRRAVLEARLPCHVYADGVTIEVDESDFEPDAVLRCGPKLADDAVAVPDPMVIVEVLSPGTKAIDLNHKPTAYFRIASLRHYLIVWPDRPKVIHHRRPGDPATLRPGEADTVETQIISAGPIVIDPPGLTICVDEIYLD